MAAFDIDAALKAYLDDPRSILTPDADSAILECEGDHDAFTPGLINSVLNPIIDAVAENPEAITQASNLDSLQFLLKQASIIPAASLGKVFDLVISGLGAEAEIVHHEELEGETETTAHKQILEIFAFLLQWCIAAVETKSAEKPTAAAPARGKGAKGAKSKASGTWDPTAQLQTALDTMTKVMKLKLSKVFTTTPAYTTFISLFTRSAYLLLESESRVKNMAIRMHTFKVLCVAIKHHNHAFAAQTSVIQNLTYFEHLAEPMAEFLNILAEQYDYPQLAEEVMKELSSKEFSASDTKGPKSVSTFVARLSELAPRVVQRQVTYLARLLESENYTLRCAIIEVCGNLIIMLSNSEEGERGENHKGQINAFFDVLEERFLDVNPYCRCRAIQVYVKLCELETKYPKRRQTAAEYAARSLQDKSSNVRRNAIKLLGRLVATHPFSVLHGGLLNYVEWSARLEVCEAELNTLQPPAGTPGLAEHGTGEQTVDDSLLDDATRVDEPSVPLTNAQRQAAFAQAQTDAATAEAMSKLQLTQRYYHEALKFISTLHSAISSIIALLGSKNKSEVIEAMDFLVIGDAYSLEPCKPGIRRMLRLIWTKGNSDEGKGVQTHLLECYRGLFFEAPGGFSENDKANYVARNMISLTFGASKAELTSLEQLLSTMMKEKVVSPLVVQKLWQVYGVQRKAISKSQRRGAIIVLGMLALADPSIVVGEMETCLRIGLGAIGKQDLAVARWTCVALMRMTAVKTVKGAEGARQSQRLPNDHAVVLRLAQLLEVEGGEGEWFGCAEQAISAIYALAKHPDVACSDVVRRKTRAVFAPTKAKATVHEGAATGEASQVDEDGDVEMSDLPEPEPEIVNEEEQTDGQQSSIPLSQLLFIVGHVALKQIVHLELCEQDFKRRKAEKEKEKGVTSSAPTPSPTKKPTKAAAAEAAAKKEAAEAADELDLIAGTTEDDFTDAIAHIRERELLYQPNALLSSFGPLCTTICTNTSNAYPSHTLQAQAALCMAKLMCVSASYCEDNLDLFLSILASSSSSAIVRSNLVVALGDMAVCFNHLIDKQTSFLYGRLSDESLVVKRTTLMTLTFLILAGQVKVKGQLAEMAKCTSSSDTLLRDMSRTFFHELAGKDNAVYNNFVDVFSLLSADTELEEEVFKGIMKFLTGFIEKDRHAKNLAGKLVLRLKGCEIERQWTDVGYVLGLLPHKSEEIARVVAEGYKVVEGVA